MNKKNTAQNSISIAIGVARKYYPVKKTEWDDLASEGLLRIVECKDDFDPSRGQSLSTFHLMQARQAMQRYLQAPRDRVVMNAVKGLSYNNELFEGSVFKHKTTAIYLLDEQFPSRSVQTREIFEMILNKMNSILSDKERMAFKLKYLEEQSIHVISNKLKKPIKKCWDILKVARGKIKNSFLLCLP